MGAAPSVVRDDPAAHAILRAAHERAYRFPTTFEGFTAAFTYADETQSARGSVEVRSPRAIALHAPEAPEPVREWITRELGSMAGHRWPRAYDDADGRWTLSLASQDHWGHVIQVHDDPFASSYRVRDGRILQVSRRTDPVQFSILLLSHTAAPDGRLLPATFVVAYWYHEQERLIRVEAYADAYVEVEGTLLPSRREVTTTDDRGVTRRELVLTEHRLLA